MHMPSSASQMSSQQREQAGWEEAVKRRYLSERSRRATTLAQRTWAGASSPGAGGVGGRQVCVELGPCAANTIFQHSALQHLARRRQLCPS